MITTKIVPNQTFKHEGEVYVEGEEYDVSEEDAEYFIEAGWVGERAEQSSHFLEVHNGVIGHNSEVN